jgi:hypothetical protein
MRAYGMYSAYSTFGGLWVSREWTWISRTVN